MATQTTTPASSLTAVPINGPATVARLQGLWRGNGAEVAAGYAYLSSLRAAGVPESAVGRGNLFEAERLLKDFKLDYGVAKKLSSGAAVLVSYVDQVDAAARVHIGVYPTSKLPAPALGGLWAYAALAVGTLLAGGWFYFRSWDKELEGFKAQTDRIFLQVAQTMADTVAQVGLTDPAAAARIAQANTAALKVAAAARKSPQSWLDKLLGTGGPPLWIWGLAALYLYSQQRGSA